MKKAISLLVLLAGMAGAFAQQPVIKVDFNEPSRKDSETLEPDYVGWKAGKDCQTDTLQVDGVTFAIRAEKNMRVGWDKAFVQAAVENSKFLGDGLNFDANADEGYFELVITGLPAGNHTIQTYHNSWKDTATYCCWPIYVYCNGQLVEKVERSRRATAMGDAAVVMSTFSVRNEQDSVVMRFETTMDDDPIDFETKTKYEVCPILNGFELNTAKAAEQAKTPFPADLDFHADADSGFCTLSWTKADSNVVAHQLYFGLDKDEVFGADTASACFVATLTDTCYQSDKLSNLHTYYWRVDEVFANGKLSKGNVWSFRPRHLAFRGAEGYGRYANGGRGGEVVYVTNLNSSGPGSFHAAIEKGSGPRTVLFMVSGVIDMQFEKFFIDDNLTIAGQSAPGKGVCLAHTDMGMGDDNIVRHIRFRRGYRTDGNGNAMGVAGCDHTIVDHCSTSWGTDETISGRNADNVTFQYSMIAEALGISHGFAATIGGNIGSYHHNFLVHCSGRNWSMAGNLDGNNNYITRMDLFNNVCYNWWKRTTDGSSHEVNFVNNYYKMGPDSNKKYLFEMQHQGYGLGTNRAYVAGNVRENKDGSLTDDALNNTYRIDISDGVTIDYETFVDEPFFPSYAEVHSARDAFKIVLSNMGADQPVLDDHDKRCVQEALKGVCYYPGSQGYQGQIKEESECGGFEVYPETSWKADFDTDLDGLPNWYEAYCGTNPESAQGDFSDSNADPDQDGYTLLEDYLDFMANPHVLLARGETLRVNLKQWFEGFTAQPEYNFDLQATSLLCQLESDSILVIKAGEQDELVLGSISVKDAEGTQYSRPFGVAVAESQLATVDALQQLEEARYIGFQAFDLNGRLAKQAQCSATGLYGLDMSGLARGIYLIRATDTDGREHSFKIVKN